MSKLTEDERERLETEFAVTLAALLAGRMDGLQARASLLAQVATLPAAPSREGES